MTTPEEFLKAYEVVKQTVDLEQQLKQEKLEQNNKKIATSVWNKFCKTLTTNSFLKKLTLQNPNNYIYFNTNLKTHAPYKEIAALFLEHGWVVSDYKWINNKMIIILVFPTPKVMPNQR